jgi:hypothetical protein
MAIIERIVTVYNDKGSKQAVKDLNKLEQNFKDAGKKIAKAFGVAALAAGALAVKLGKDGVEAAIADQKSQALLANALRNTTGATDSAIAGVEDYIATQQRLVSVTDDELRPSLTTLLNATQDITEAQALQSLALDISAGAQKDLQSVSLALAKAVGGNIGALTKLGVPLSEDIKKSKDLNAALDELGKTFAGAASTRAQTFEGRMQGIQIAFSEALETLGFAFLPVLEDLVVVFQTQVIPAFEKFIAQNKDELAGALGDIIEFLIKATKGLGSMFKTISDNLTTFKIFTALIVGTFVGTKVAAGIGAIIAALKLLTGVFKKQAVAGTAAGTATAFATGGTSAFAAAAGITAFTAAVGGTLLVLNKMTNSLDDNTEAIQKNSQVVTGHLADLNRLSQATATANIKNKALTVTTAGLNKKTKEQLATERALAALRKLGVKPTAEKDPIQLEAARLNLLKQANLEEAARVNALIANMEAQMKLNEAAQRYTDLLQVLSDAVISDEEVSVLAQKWNITKGEVLEYIARIYAANSTDLNDGPIVNLLMKWGLTKEEAEKYVDFTRALKDEKIDDSEIEKLMGKWGMTRAEVLAYGKTVQDGTALQAALSKGWSLPGDEAAQSWRNALAALNAYLAALGAPRVAGATGGAGGGGGGGGGGGSGGGGGDGFVANPFNPASAAVSISKIEEQIDTLTSLRDATEKGTAISVLLKEHIDTLTDSISTSGLGALSDERARMQAMGMFDGPGISAGSTFDPGSFRMAENAGMTVNVTVEGNVQTEADLANAIRQRILLEQQSGNPILFVGGL